MIKQKHKGNFRNGFTNPMRCQFKNGESTERINIKIVKRFTNGGVSLKRNW